MIYDETLNLLRAIFPKWNFFDKQGAIFRLSYQDFNSKEKVHWTEYNFKKQSLKIYQLFLNSEHNLNLAKYNIVEHFVDWFLEKNRSVLELENESSFYMIRNLIEDKVTNKYRIKIEAIQKESTIIIYESNWLNK